MTEGAQPQNLQETQTKNSIKTPEERLLEAYTTYNSLVKAKMKDFEAAKTYLAETMERLLEQGKIGKGVLILSRVKSPASVVEKWKRGKGLYDIYGVTILTQNQEQIEEIQAALLEDNKFETSAKKKKSEKRGYEAIHFVFYVGEEGKKTQVECHLQTHDAYREVYTHICYKVREKLGRNLTQEEEAEVERQIQTMYESGRLSGIELPDGNKSKLPQMSVMSFTPQGEMHEQSLDETQTLKIMYPFLDLSRKRPEDVSTGTTEGPTYEEPEEK